MNLRVARIKPPWKTPVANCNGYSLPSTTLDLEKVMFKTSELEILNCMMKAFNFNIPRKALIGLV